MGFAAVGGRSEIYNRLFFIFPRYFSCQLTYMLEYSSSRPKSHFNDPIARPLVFPHPDAA
jgi:hypothetical protein